MCESSPLVSPGAALRIIGGGQRNGLTPDLEEMKIAYKSEDADVLTAVLSTLQFRGQVFCYSEFTAPWALRLPSSDFAHFHVFERGEGWIKLEESESPISLASGDLVIVPQGGGHILGDNPKTRAVDLEKLLKRRSAKDHVVRHGGGGSQATVVCGSLRFETQMGNPILALLPPIIHISQGHAETGVWLGPLLKLLAHEAQNPGKGSGWISSHLSGIIFVQAVRAWIEMQPKGQGGWLGALRDKQISAALNLIHQNPDHPWTIAKLAAEVGMSRSPFANKFNSLVGEPPLSYLTRWRMSLAAGYLRNEQIRISEIAERVGYESQASFSNAFKRAHAISPRGFRERFRGKAT
ncbi:MAG: AraC family transcriptional regulator [Pyrinomonadaceae bacterium]